MTTDIMISAKIIAFNQSGVLQISSGDNTRHNIILLLLDNCAVSLVVNFSWESHVLTQSRAVSTLKTLEDKALVELCLTSTRPEPDVFSILVERYEGFVFRVALRYLGNRADAEDATQESFVKAFRGLANFRQEAQFKTWLMKILHNVCMTALNDRKRRLSIDPPEGEDEAIHQVPDQHDDYNQYIDNDEIRRTLEQMSEQERQIIVLRLIAELSLQEAADTLGLSLSAAKMRFYRAQQRFAEIYQQNNSPTNVSHDHEQTS